MKIKETERIGKLWFEDLWSKSNLNIADEIVDPEYAPSWILIDKKGAAQVKHEINYFRSIFPDLIYTIIDINGEKDKVWIRYSAQGTQKGKAWGFEATNKQVKFEGATILYINSKGKIIDRWGAFCFYEILMLLDLVPPFWELHKIFETSKI
ncbi:MAG: ester cyclase [Candidatus Heimdallarchaeota archaeon]